MEDFSQLQTGFEGHALYKAKEKRDTNAARYMQLFAEHPFKNMETNRAFTITVQSTTWWCRLLQPD